jgi:hypothetical protein
MTRDLMSILVSDKANISEDRSVDKENMKTALLMELGDMSSLTHENTRHSTREQNQL